MPTLVDDGFALWESRAIMVYLVEKYGKTASLYPSDPAARALVNQRLYFDLGTLYQRLADYYYPQIFAKQPANPDNLKKLEDAAGFLNTFLEGQTYAVSFISKLKYFFNGPYGSNIHSLIITRKTIGWTKFDPCWHLIGGYRVNIGCSWFRFVEISKCGCLVREMQGHRSRIRYQRSRYCRVQEVLELNIKSVLRRILFYSQSKFVKCTLLHLLLFFIRHSKWHEILRTWINFRTFVHSNDIQWYSINLLFFLKSMLFHLFIL